MYLGAIVLGSFLASAPGAWAADGAATSVSVRGMDLSDPAARAELEHRIDRAAAIACKVDRLAQAAARREQNLCLIAAGNEGRAQLKRMIARNDVRMAGL
jgi:UrcA family protein